ncbi:histidine kinase [Paractinoplanes bogorensis]|uniref:histidine kinase n=1 Tax=Paractinoplanes bogorensis TaxID=1610840 RepID=UPI0027E1ECCD|nr:histidine kinase [Actinoplanes bogorensis]
MLLERRRRPLPVLAAVVVLTGAGQLSGFAAVVWAAALTMRFVRQQRVTAAERRDAAERERTQLTRLAVAEERATIARELHDIVAHSLFLVTASTDVSLLPPELVDVVRAQPEIGAVRPDVQTDGGLSILLDLAGRSGARRLRR